MRRLLAAARRGDAFAQHQLGAIYATGDFGTEVDLKKAVSFYKLAASAGDADSLYDLGIMYMRGEGMRKNKQKGFRMLLKAARMGLSDAQTLLGMIYETGHFGFRRNQSAARRWYRMAAKKNNILARSYLRRMNRRKRGQIRTD